MCKNYRKFMARCKIPIDKKKIKIGGTIDPELNEIFNSYLKEIGNYNKSQYLEKLIKEDLIKNNKI